MVFIPKHLGDVPGSLSFLLASTTGQGCYKTSNEESKTKVTQLYKKHIYHGLWLDCDSLLLLKQTSKYSLMTMHRFL